MEERAFPDIDNKVNLCYYSSQTLCTAYQTTVQTEQTVNIMGSGCRSDSGS